MDIRGLHLPERVHVLDRFNGSEKFISNELAEAARIWGHDAHALMHHAEKRVYDIHRSWVESCHRFVVNCWNRFTRAFLEDGILVIALLSRGNF